MTKNEHVSNDGEIIEHIVPVPRHGYQRTRVIAKVPEDSKAQQHMADECDINKIMEKYEKTGLVTHVNRFQGDYSDYLDTPEDLHDAMNRVIEAENMFMTLPAKVRARYDNDPAKFLDFVDKADDKALNEAGLLPNELYAHIEARNAEKGAKQQKSEAPREGAALADQAKAASGTKTPPEGGTSS